MGINVIKWPKPKLYLSLESGGDLEPNTTYYFIGWFQSQMGGYYGGAVSPASDEYSITTDASNKKIKCEWWQDGGDVTGYADNGDGTIQVTTSAAHGRSDGDTVWIRGTTNYDGSYTISNASGSTFDITATWVADDGASKWFADQEAPTDGDAGHYNGIKFKWDKYTMIDAGDGEPYQWLNLNDPANTGKDEFDETYGHRKWSHYYYDRGYRNNQYSGSITWDAEGGTSDTDLKTSASSSLSRSEGTNHPALAYRDDSGYGLNIDPHFSRQNGRLLIHIPDDQDYDQDDLMTALISSGYDDMMILNPASINTYNHINYAGKSITLLAEIQKSGSTYAFTIARTFIELLGGVLNNSSNFDKTKTIFNSSEIRFKGMAYYFWVESYITMNDSIYTAISRSSILDKILFNNTRIQAVASTFYYAAEGVEVLGDFVLNDWYQIAYPASGVGNGSSDVISIGVAIYGTINSAEMDGVQRTYYFDNMEWRNDGIVGYDYYINLGYLADDGSESFDGIFEFTNAKNDRPDGKIVMYFYPDSGRFDYATAVCNFRYVIDLIVTDEDGDVIDGASVELSWSGGSDTDTTDANGEAQVTGLSYTVELDKNDADGNGYNTNTSNSKSMILRISKAGYKTYNHTGFVLTKAEEWRIALQSLANVPSENDVENGVTYDDGENNYTGNLQLPAASVVKKNEQYGANGTEFTGTYLPEPAESITVAIAEETISAAVAEETIEIEIEE